MASRIYIISLVARLWRRGPRQRLNQDGVLSFTDEEYLACKMPVRYVLEGSETEILTGTIGPNLVPATVLRSMVCRTLMACLESLSYFSTGARGKSFRLKRSWKVLYEKKSGRTYQAGSKREVPPSVIRTLKCTLQSGDASRARAAAESATIIGLRGAKGQGGCQLNRFLLLWRLARYTNRPTYFTHEAQAKSDGNPED